MTMHQFDLFGLGGLGDVAQPVAPPAPPARREVSVAFERVQRPGDIAASYCADTLMLSSKTREPFEFEGARWVATAISYRMFQRVAEAYRIIPAETVEAQIAAKKPGDIGSQLGGYHGRKATCSGQPVVLIGPPVMFDGIQPEDERGILP